MHGSTIDDVAFLSYLYPPHDICTTPVEYVHSNVVRSKADNLNTTEAYEISAAII